MRDTTLVCGVSARPRRFRDVVLVQSESVCGAGTEVRRNLSKRSKAIDPIANFNENGDLKWNDAELVKEIKIFAQRTKPRAAGGR
jgi:hypothetical protein